MHKPIPALTTIALVFGLAACGKAEAPFCHAVDANRDAFLAALKVENSDARRARLATAVRETPIEDWNGKVAAANTDIGGLGLIRIALPCKATLIAGEIAPASALFAQMTQIKARDAVTFDGSFVAAPTGTPYLEISLTQNGMMTDPEFVIRLAAIRK
jgi:hypothetical protein